MPDLVLTLNVHLIERADLIAFQLKVENRGEVTSPAGRRVDVLAPSGVAHTFILPAIPAGGVINQGSNRSVGAEEDLASFRAELVVCE